MDELTFTTSEQITRGWSSDLKYKVMDHGTPLLLRISPIERYEHRRGLFTLLERAAALDIPMSRPVKLGICKEGVYVLYTWIEGNDLEDLLPDLPPNTQQQLGYQSGGILRRIHSIPAPASLRSWAIRCNEKIDRTLQRYSECPLRFDGDEQVIDYIQSNRALLRERPQCFQHGDYHVGNMMIENGGLVIIDFDRFDFGDPWEEFNRLIWNVRSSPIFAKAQLDGYFGGQPPLEFFKLIALYNANNTLASLPWAIPFGEDEVRTMMENAQELLSWYDHMKSPIPSWYGALL